MWTRSLYHWFPPVWEGTEVTLLDERECESAFVPRVAVCGCWLFLLLSQIGRGRSEIGRGRLEPFFFGREEAFPAWRKGAQSCYIRYLFRSACVWVFRSFLEMPLASSGAKWQWRVPRLPHPQAARAEQARDGRGTVVWVVRTHGGQILCAPHQQGLWFLPPEAIWCFFVLRTYNPGSPYRLVWESCRRRFAREDAGCGHAYRQRRLSEIATKCCLVLCGSRDLCISLQLVPSKRVYSFASALHCWCCLYLTMCLYSGVAPSYQRGVQYFSGRWWSRQYRGVFSGGGDERPLSRGGIFYGSEYCSAVTAVTLATQQGVSLISVGSC